ncbi:aminotransferase class III-fold pyridoxal phosphate-dependent enzyme, partial [Oscillochloris sp. ZM17-4]|uniref:aminotransferase class III-fold pyridoxal phosphate-dependent enzyme n=1 Tax=Oscillochloris sp. ZM17-4 TaxID=2866714 RepID=UPI001C72FB6A
CRPRGQHPPCPAAGLPGEYDRNFRLDAADGAQYVHKVVHPDRPEDEIDLQVRGLLHVQGVGGWGLGAGDHTPTPPSQLPTPTVIPALDGQLLARRQVGGEERLVWMLSYLPGTVLAEVRPHHPALLRDLGRWLGSLAVGLSGFDHPLAERPYKWDLAQAGWIGSSIDIIDDEEDRALVAGIYRELVAETLPALARTRRQAIHGDANDYNVIVDTSGGYPYRVAGVIDFGDLIRSHLACDVAVACAYAILGKADPLPAAAELVAGYHQSCPLTEDELGLIFPLLRARLAVSVVNSAMRKAEEPGDPYLTISEAPAWAALRRLEGVSPRLAHYLLRAACGMPAVPHTARVEAFLRESAPFAPVLGFDLGGDICLPLDLSVGSPMLGADPASCARPRLTQIIDAALAEAGARVGVGGYNEPRMLYSNELFAGDAGSPPTPNPQPPTPNPLAERRTIHLGVDLWVAAGTPVCAPLDGVVHIVAENAAPLDYGPLLILRHQTSEGDSFYTLYGHLAGDALDMRVGQDVRAGQQIASVGPPPRNGDWPPHLHLQIITDLLGRDADFPGVALASQRATWLSLSPDPTVLLDLPKNLLPPPPPSYGETLATRRARLGGNLSLSYREPLKIVRGWRQYLYDETGRAYLDMYNNVPHVGHSHPRVVRAVQGQVGLLTTNTRYLHDTINRYAERLCALLPAPLEVCYFLNSASEANELALRLARAHTYRYDMIVMDTAYHGHTTALIDISPYKFNGPGGEGPRPWVHVAPVPDDYRGPFRRDDPARGARYAASVGAIIARMAAEGRGPAGFIAESLPSVGGQIVPPPGYLAAVYNYVRAAGGVCIADEVQVGFGRLGAHFWGFAMQGVVPDIVVLGKPIGNGQPLGAVVTTRAIADSFDNGMEFFSTFGGNPVSCAAGLAVLDVLRDENLPDNAAAVGQQILDGLTALMERHPAIGDVRGVGLFLGLELVRDRESREPAPEIASYLVNRLRERGILAGTDGPYHNVIKLRPSMIFSPEDADLFLEVFADIW